MALLLQYNKDAGIKFSIEQQCIRIGRGVENDICINDDLVSKEHAIIEVVLLSKETAQVEYIIQDLKSTNHTYVNDDPVSLYKLKNGDMIRIGVTNFKFVDEKSGELDETSKLHRTWIPGVFYTGDKNK